MLASKPVHVVDDDVGFLKGIERLLTMHNLKVRTFASAEEFRAQTNPNDAACIILDVHLGDNSGIDLKRELSRQGATTPVIFVTASNSERTHDAALAAGCSDLLLKPFSVKVLMEALGKALQTDNGSSF
jgi:FixJ family two-component response regulator